jgi:acyl carrier protein
MAANLKRENDSGNNLISMDTEAKVRAFIIQNFYVANPERLDTEASLLDNGVIDSTGVLEVIAFIEEQLGVEVADEEMLPENLDSIGRICRFVGRKRA